MFCMKISGMLALKDTHYTHIGNYTHDSGSVVGAAGDRGVEMKALE